MTDYSASALNGLAKQIAEKAIARDLFENYQWYGTAERGFQAGNFEEMLPPVTGPTGTMEIRLNTLASSPNPGSPPPGAIFKGEDFQAQPPVYKWDIDPWTSIYEPWFNRINDALQGWDGLPEPTSYDGPLSMMREAVTSLSPIPVKSGLSTSDFDSVDLQSNLGLLDHWINDATPGADQGLLILAFDSKYGYARVSGVLQNQAQVGVVLGMTVLGEQRVWTMARADIMTLAEEAVKAFDLTQGGGSIDFSLIHAFVDLVSDFVPEPIKGVLSVGQHALSLVEAVKPPEQATDPHPDISGSDVSSIYDSFCDAINKLSNLVWNQEYDLVATCGKLLDAMREGPGSQFDINPGAGVDPELVDAKQLTVHPEALKRIGYETVPNIAAVMGKASQQADAANAPGIWSRPGTIGYVPTGPYDKWTEVLTEFDAVTTGSAHELVEAGALLARGAGFLHDTDGLTAKALKGVAGQISKGKDGWDNSKVGLPPPTEYQLPSGKWIPI